MLQANHRSTCASVTCHSSLVSCVYLQLRPDCEALANPPIFRRKATRSTAASNSPGAVCIADHGISVSIPVAISAADQITSRLIHARRKMPTPSFSNTSNAMNAVTTR